MMTPQTNEDQMSDEKPRGYGRRARVMVTKIGLDGHDRGSRLVAAFLRDAGMEVIYTAPWQTVDSVLNQAIQEDVDVIGISSLATDHLLVPKLMDAMRERGVDDIAVVVGGIVPPEDEEMLLQAGVANVYQPGDSRDVIVDGIRALVDARQSAMG